MQFSQSTVRLFNELFNDYKLPANHPNFIELANMINFAKQELTAYYKDQEKEVEKPENTEDEDKSVEDN